MMSSLTGMSLLRHGKLGGHTVPLCGIMLLSSALCDHPCKFPYSLPFWKLDLYLVCQFLSINHITILVTTAYVHNKCSPHPFPLSSLYESFALIQLPLNLLFHFKRVVCLVYLLIPFSYLLPILQTHCSLVSIS